ncbi:restriction endonuclease subunit S [Trueperella pyogenes]|uniref:restriction endonuclease subunit S n=1 Tax=Trueperella pyogenes TaxID=1661 RepID=UPI00345CDA9C
MWLADRSGGCSGDVLALRIAPHFSSRLIPGFLYYSLSSDNFFKFNVQHSCGGKMPRGNKAKILEYRIPVPPLEVQREIVRILDGFTKLEARRKQYAFYRDQLLTFTPEGERTKWLPLGELFFMQAGRAKPSNAITGQRTQTDSIPVYGGNGIRGYTDQPSDNEDALIIGRQGALCGNVVRAVAPFYATEHAVVTRAKDTMQVDQRWAFHLLTQADLNQYATKSAQPGLSVATLSRVSVPVPPLEEQRRIVAILDKFDALVNDISSGLPAEIEARRKQYEHYRDRLLTFPELNG